MLSSCWLTSPFSGCFNTAIKGVVGGVHETSDAGFTRTRMSQPPPTQEKTLANGSAGGFPSTGVTLGGGRGAPGVVTTIAPKASATQESKAPPSGQLQEKILPQESTQQQQQQPQTPRKSKSMGRIHGSGGVVAAGEGGGLEGGSQNAPANKEEGGGGGFPPTAYRGHRRVPSDGVAWRHSKAMESEMEGEDKFMKRTYKSEYRKKFRPFSQYQYVDGKFHKSKQDGETGNTWYKEVLELRKQAGQYRCRGWGVETASDRMAEIYTKQVELWEQVSRRSSLQALSLASAAPSRPISKAEKEIENSRRSSPIKHARERPSTAPAKQKPAAVHKPPAAADKTDGKPQKESTTPRHHYEKTTGSGDGFFITSPSRDRIEPVISSDLATRRSPRKTPPVTSPVKEGIANKRRAPRAISVARTSTAKESKPPNKSSPSIGKAAVSSSSAGKKADIVGRSVSVGPENRSPKRTSRPPSSTHPPAPATKERRPRPTSLTTSSRRKGADSAIPHHEAKKTTKKPHDISASPKRSADLKSRDEKRQSSDEDVKKDGILKESFKEAAGRKSTPEPRFDPEKYEPVVKTPPEPTRVKSPDQVMVKSPDPVNWTVPLDTGKTFTVTSNVPEGEASRGTPSSEHRPPLESRSRQTPEPTKVYQGSLAGTPITTAGTTSSAPSASTATATIVSTSSHLPSKTEPVSTVKTTSSSIPSSVSAADIPKEPVSGVGSDSSLLPSSNIKPVDDKKTNELPTEISSLSTASKPLDSKSLSSIKETSPQPSESPKPYQELPKPSEVLEAKSSPASSLSSSVGLSSGILEVVGSFNTNDNNISDSFFQGAQRNDALLTLDSGKEVVDQFIQLSGKSSVEDINKLANLETETGFSSLNSTNDDITDEREKSFENEEIYTSDDVNTLNKENIDDFNVHVVNNTLLNNDLHDSDQTESFSENESKFPGFESLGSELSDRGDYDLINAQTNQDIKTKEIPETLATEEHHFEDSSVSSSIINLDSAININSNISELEVVQEKVVEKHSKISDELATHKFNTELSEDSDDSDIHEVSLSAIEQEQYTESKTNMFETHDESTLTSMESTSDLNDNAINQLQVEPVVNDFAEAKLSFNASKTFSNNTLTEEKLHFTEDTKNLSSSTESIENASVPLKTEEAYMSNIAFEQPQDKEKDNIKEHDSYEGQIEPSFNLVKDYDESSSSNNEEERNLEQNSNYQSETISQTLEYTQNIGENPIVSINSDFNTVESQFESDNISIEHKSIENDRLEGFYDKDETERKELLNQEDLVENTFLSKDKFDEDELSNKSFDGRFGVEKEAFKLDSKYDNVYSDDVNKSYARRDSQENFAKESLNIREDNPNFYEETETNHTFTDENPVNFSESNYFVPNKNNETIEAKQFSDYDEASENLSSLNSDINTINESNKNEIPDTQDSLYDLNSLSNEDKNLVSSHQMVQDSYEENSENNDFDKYSFNHSKENDSHMSANNEYFKYGEASNYSESAKENDQIFYNENITEGSNDAHFYASRYPVKESHNYNDNTISKEINVTEHSEEHNSDDNSSDDEESSEIKSVTKLSNDNDIAPEHNVSNSEILFNNTDKIVDHEGDYDDHYYAEGYPVKESNDEDNYITDVKPTTFSENVTLRFEDHNSDNIISDDKETSHTEKVTKLSSDNYNVLEHNIPICEVSKVTERDVDFEQYSDNHYLAGGYLVKESNYDDNNIVDVNPTSFEQKMTEHKYDNNSDENSSDDEETSQAGIVTKLPSDNNVTLEHNVSNSEMLFNNADKIVDDHYFAGGYPVKESNYDESYKTDVNQTSFGQNMTVPGNDDNSDNSNSDDEETSQVRLVTNLSSDTDVPNSEILLNNTDKIADHEHDPNDHYLAGGYPVKESNYDNNYFTNINQTPFGQNMTVHINDDHKSDNNNSDGKEASQVELVTKLSTDNNKVLDHYIPSSEMLNDTEKKVDYEQYSDDDHYSTRGYHVKESDIYDDSYDKKVLPSSHTDEFNSDNSSDDEDSNSVEKMAKFSNDNIEVLEHQISNCEMLYNQANPITVDDEQDKYDDLGFKNKDEQENISVLKYNSSSLDKNLENADEVSSDAYDHVSIPSSSALLKKRVSFSIADNSDNESNSSTESINGEIKENEMSNNEFDVEATKVVGHDFRIMNEDSQAKMFQDNDSDSEYEDQIEDNKHKIDTSLNLQMSSNENYKTNSDDFTERFSYSNTASATYDDNQSHDGKFEDEFQNNSRNSVLENILKENDFNEVNSYSYNTLQNDVAQVQSYYEQSVSNVNETLESSKEKNFSFGENYEVGDKYVSDQQLKQSANSGKNNDFESDNESQSSEKSQILVQSSDDVYDKNIKVSSEGLTTTECYKNDPVVSEFTYEKERVDEMFNRKSEQQDYSDSDDDENIEKRGKNVAKRLFASSDEEDVNAVKPKDNFSGVKYFDSDASTFDISINKNSSTNISSDDDDEVVGNLGKIDEDTKYKDLSTRGQTDFSQHTFQPLQFEKYSDGTDENNISKLDQISNENIMGSDFQFSKLDDTSYKANEPYCNESISTDSEHSFAAASINEIMDESFIKESSEFRSDDPSLFANAELKYDLKSSDLFHSSNPLSNAEYNSNTRDLSPIYDHKESDSKLNPFNDAYYKTDGNDSPFDKVNNQNNNNSFSNAFETSKFQTFENNHLFKTGNNENGMDSNEEAYDSYESSDSMVIKHDVTSINQNSPTDEAYSTLCTEDLQDGTYNKVKLSNEADTFSSTTSPWHTN